MKTLAAIFVLFVVALLAGCGGSGGGSATSHSTFQGAFSGPWTATDSSVGNAQLTIDGDGDFTGNFQNITDSIQGAFHGHITGDGTFDGALTINGNDYTGTGTFTLSQDEEHLTGTFVHGNTTWTFTLTRGISA